MIKDLLSIKERLTALRAQEAAIETDYTSAMDDFRQDLKALLQSREGIDTLIHTANEILNPCGLTILVRPRSPARRRA